MQSEPRVLRYVILSALALGGCGVTLGVDVEERAAEFEAPADGVVTFEMQRVAVDDAVSIQGEPGERISGHLEMLDWSKRRDSIRVEVALRGDVARLQMVGTESMSLVSIDASIPRSVETSIELTHGGLELSELDAPVFAKARSITLRNIAAPVVAEQGEVRLNYTIPIDLDSEGSVGGFLGAGGTINTDGDANLSLTRWTMSDFELHSLSDDPQGSVVLHLPPSGHFTLLVRTPGQATVDYEDIYYDSLAEGAPSAAAGLTFDVGGGGPLITVTSRAGSVTIVSPSSSPTP